MRAPAAAGRGLGKRLWRSLLALALGALACRSVPPSPATIAPQLTRILASGALRVGLSGSQPPLNMRTPDGGVRGFEVDIVRGLAESMGLQLRFKVLPFAELLPALSRGEVDLVISGLTITPERNARVAFAGPYLVSGKSILARAGSVEPVQDAEALDRSSRRWAALAGSTSERFIRTTLPHAQLVSTADYEGAVQKVIDGEVDGLIADFPVCAWQAARHPEAGLEALPAPFTVEPLGIALPPDDPLFTNLVQNHLTTLRETGLLARFKARWLSGEPQGSSHP